MVQDLERHLTCTEGCIEAPLDDSLILLHVDTGLYYRLNPVARFAWEIMRQGTTFENMVAKTLEVFDVERGVCEEELRVLVDMLASAGLIVDGN